MQGTKNRSGSGNRESGSDSITRFVRAFPFVQANQMYMRFALIAAVFMATAGDLQNQESMVNCGSVCTLGAGNTDADFAQ
jgi:hypothetical protein